MNKLQIKFKIKKINNLKYRNKIWLIKLIN